MKLIYLIFILNIFNFTCCAQKDLNEYLTEKYDSNKLNGTVLIVKKGKTIYRNSFGYSDGTKTKKLNENFRFIIGSIYKEFPAVAIMQLKEKNKIKLNDPINKYLTELPNWSKKIKIKHLLKYTSGLPMIDWGKYFTNNITIKDSHILKDLFNIKKLQFTPGSDYLYTNYCPILLMKIIEKITEKDFKTYVQEKILKPNNLTNIIIRKEYPYTDKTLMAIPFNEEYKEDAYKLAIPYLLFTATTQDLYTWMKQLHDFKIITKKSLKILSEEYNGSGNIQAPLGYCEWKDDSVVEHSHHGSSGNYEAIIRFFKKEDMFIVILTNQKHRNVRDISNEIRKIVTNN